MVSAVSVALNRLHDAGVLRPLTNRKRDQVWGAVAILGELEALNVRIAAAARGILTGPGAHTTDGAGQGEHDV